MQFSMMRTWIEINLRALTHNLAILEELAAGAELCCVIKSNAYGHGLSLFAAYLESYLSVRSIAVATISEGVLARSAGFTRRIIALASQDLSYRDAAESSIEIVCFSLENARSIRATVECCNFSLLVHLKVDTGLSRLGILPREFERVRTLLTHPRIIIVGLMTHLSDKDNVHDDFVRLQMRTLAALTVDQAGVVHALSSGALEYSRFYKNDWVRVGTNMYGFYSSDNSLQRMQRLVSRELVPILSWKSRIVQRAGNDQSCIGIVPVGLADGYPRVNPSTAYVRVGEKLCEVLSVEIDCLHIALAKDVPVGAEVSLIDAQQETSAYRLARAASLIPIGVTTGLHYALPRHVVSHEIIAQPRDAERRIAESVI